MRDAVQQVKVWMRSLSPRRQAEVARLLRKSPSAAIRKMVEQSEAAGGKAEREACSGPRINAYKNRGVPYKDPGMKRARGAVKFGDAPRGTRRWTPADAIKSEDRYDQMSVERASACGDAPSITGRQLETIRQRRLNVEHTKTTRKKKAD